jgi:hypothetical protein
MISVSAQIAPVEAEGVDGGTLVGRWDITVDEGGTAKPSWMEVEISGFETLVGRFVATGGSARPISKIHFDNGKFSFEIPPQWEKSDKDLRVEGNVTKNRIEGVIHEVNGKDHSFTGVPAPFLTEKKTVKWGKPIKLFNGKNLDGWKTSGKKNQWTVQHGVLISPESGSNLISEQTFTDFKLHVEFKYDANSNSGVYLRGRYEVQIIDNPPTDHPNSHLFGGVYGFLTPSEMAVGSPGEWQSFDITLIGRMVTIVANDKTIISNQEIPGITGGAINSNEGEPGPIYFQGDHGPIQFRNIVITPAL